MKIEIEQHKFKGCDDSFFYNGLIATKEIKEGTAKLYASGEIKLLDKNGDLIHDGWKARGNCLGINNDKELNKELKNDGEFVMNNWFEILIADKDDIISGDGEVCADGYDEAIKELKELI